MIEDKYILLLEIYKITLKESHFYDIIYYTQLFGKESYFC